MMKKSTFGAILAFLAAAVGVLTAVAIYLYRREKELDEYEELLFGDDLEEEEEVEVEEVSAEEAAQTAEAPAPVEETPAAE